MPKKEKKKEGGILKAVKKVLGKNPDKKTRGHYKQKECPYCHKHVGNLGNHIKLKHPMEEPPKELTKDDLITPKKTIPKRDDLTYYCNNCRAALRKNENPCWNCGSAMNWSALNE